VKRVLATLHAHSVSERRNRRLAELLAEALPQGARCLDVGAGDGAVAAELVARRPDLHLEGIDVMVREGARIPVRLFDGREIPLPDAGTDAVILVDVLHHTDDPGVLLAEARRVARRAVVIKDHLCDSRLDWATLAAMDWLRNAPVGVRLPYNYQSSEGWQRLFARAGLEPDLWRTDLSLYAWPLRPLFDRKLHFVARLVPRTP
jgi:ubiquinone/menaquinone biosynthesis C-methylase UbiE